MARGEPRSLDAAEIERRKPVWIALSGLWLDTELSDVDLRRIAGSMRRSGDSVEELRDVSLFEVAPVVFTNLLSVAGECAGFDEVWLVDQVTKRVRRRSTMLRAFVRLGVGARLLTFAKARNDTGRGSS